jgi:hypothetical protein
LLGSIDLFWILVLVNLSIGLGVFVQETDWSGRTISPVLYVVGALIVAGVRTVISGA